MPGQPLSVQPELLRTMASLVENLEATDRFYARLDAVDPPLPAFGDQQRLITAVQAWTARWTHAAVPMVESLRASADTIDDAGVAYRGHDAATAAQHDGMRRSLD